MTGVYGRLVRPARRRRARWWPKGTHSKHAYVAAVAASGDLIWRSHTQRRPTR